MASVLMLVQPLEAFNSNGVNRFDKADVIVKEINQMSADDNIFRFKGILNQYLLLIQTFLRFFFAFCALVSYYFQDQLRLSRIYSVFGVKFKFFRKIKFMFHRFQIKFSLAICIAVFIFFLVLMQQYEVVIQNISPSIIEQGYYLVITMLTTGYGDIVAVSFLGQQSIIIATFCGVGLEAMFMIAFKKYIDFTFNEE